MNKPVTPDTGFTVFRGSPAVDCHAFKAHMAVQTFCLCFHSSSLSGMSLVFDSSRAGASVANNTPGRGDVASTTAADER